MPNLLSKPDSFAGVYVWSDVWQHIGWDSIIYLAALSAIDPTYYEAATMDGASRMQKDSQHRLTITFTYSNDSIDFKSRKLIKYRF